MTGTFPDPVAIKNGMKTVTGTGGPDTDDQTTQDPANAQPDEGEFAVEYTMQTGPTRYAPMQPVPKTKITKKKATPQYPTSSVNIAKAILPTPKIQTTITQSQTHSVSSMANTVRHKLLKSPEEHTAPLSRLRLDYITAQIRLTQVSERRGSHALRRHGQVPREVEGLMCNNFHTHYSTFLGGQFLAF